MVGYEVLGVERRRRWSVAQKRRIVAEAFSSAEGVSSIARRHGLYPQQIYRWRRELEDGGIGEAPLHFLPVSVVAAVDGEGAAPARETVCLEIGCVGGRCLRLDGPIDDTRLQRLIRLVETA